MTKTSTTIFTISVLILASIVSSPAGETANQQQTIDLSDPSIIEMIQQVNESMVFYYHNNLMSFGPRYTGSENCRLAGQYIFDEFENMGLNVEFHNWQFARFKSRNVVATLNGVDPSSNAVFIISAHYDTVQTSPGADDDGSGVAAMLAIANIMSQYLFNHTIRFIAFSGEEVGSYGSFTYARDAYNNGDNIVAAINLDMVGYANTTRGGQIIRYFTPERSQWIPDFASTVSEKYLDLIDLTVEARPNYIGADHQAFIDYGYDSVFIAHHDGYPWGHSPEDTPDHLNWTYQVKATKLVLAVLAELAFKPIDIQIILTSPFEGYGYFFDQPIIPVGLGKRSWYRGTRGLTFILGRAMASADVITTEEIEYVIFCIDGNFIVWDSEPPYEWKIQGKHSPPVGRHKLKVYAYTISGKVAMDEMDILIFTLSCQYGMW